MALNRYRLSKKIRTIFVFFGSYYSSKQEYKYEHHSKVRNLEMHPHTSIKLLRGFRGHECTYSMCLPFRSPHTVERLMASWASRAHVSGGSPCMDSLIACLSWSRVCGLLTYITPLRYRHRYKSSGMRSGSNFSESAPRILFEYTIAHVFSFAPHSALP